MFYETVYETGRVSVAMYESDEEARRAIGEHHRRAVNGEPGAVDAEGNRLWVAERIRAVYVYDKHPNDYNSAQTASADVLKKEVAALIDEAKDENGVVAIDQLTLGVRGLSHPMIAEGEKDGPFGTIFKAKEKKQLDLKFLTDVEAA